MFSVVTTTIFRPVLLNGGNLCWVRVNLATAATWLAHLYKCRSAEQEVAVSNTSQTNSYVLKITEENVLPLLRHLQMVIHSCPWDKDEKPYA